MTRELAILGRTADGQPLELDVARLIGSHMAIVANSGAGKSGLIRKLLEATHGRIQQIVLDAEDEFYTLRERFEYVIAGGDGGDAPASVDNAETLAIGALTHGFSLIAQLNDLGFDGAPDFIGRFLTALVNAPRDLWHPVLVVVDEAQRFVPRQGDTGATAGVKDLISRGRKRGFTAILAGTKFTEIDPSVRGSVNNWLLGRVGQAVDRNTMGNQLGFTPAESREKLRSIEPRHFWAAGPALSAEPVLFRVDDVATTPVHAGQAKVPTPPAPEALRAILQGLAPAPGPGSAAAAPAGRNAAKAEEGGQLQARDAEIKRLRGELARERHIRSVLHRQRDFFIFRLQHLRGLAWVSAADLDSFGASVGVIHEAERDVLPADRKSKRNAGSAEEVSSPSPRNPRSGVGEARAVPERSTSASPEPGPAAGDAALRGRKALAALLQHNTGRTERQWAWVAGFSVKGGTWGTYKSALRAAGLVEERDGKWWPTAAALRLELGEEQRFPMLGPELVRSWKGKIPGVGRMVDELLKLWPEWTLRANLADRLNMAAEGGTFGTYISRLASARLIERQGKKIRLNPEAMGAV